MQNITVQRILGVLLHRIRFIIVLTVAVGLLAFLYTNFFITPIYSTSTMIFVQNYSKSNSKSSGNSGDADSGQSSGSSDYNSSNNEQAQKIFNSDISGSASLAGITVTLFQNSDEITSLYDGCDVNISAVSGTFYIVITTSGADPEKCANVANQVADACNEVFHKNFMYGQLGVIRTAKTPGAPISPNKVQNTLIGAGIGLAAACLIAILLELIDTTIKPDEDLSEIYKIPVFAEIPDFSNGSR